MKTLEDYHKKEDFTQEDWKFLEEMLDDIIQYRYYSSIPSWFHCLVCHIKKHPMKKNYSLLD